MTNYTSKAVKGASVVLVFSAMASVIGYLTRMVLARSLTPAEYGLFYAVFTFVIFFLFFRDLGLGAALVKYASEWRALKKFNEIKTAIAFVFLVQLGSSIVIGTIFFFLSDYLSQHYFKDPQAAAILKILIFYLFFSILFIITKQIFQSFQKMFLYATVEFMKNMVVLASVVLFLMLGFNALAPAFAFAFVGVVLFILYFPHLLKISNLSKYRMTEFSPISKKLIGFGIPVLVTDVGAQIIGYIDTLILTHYRSLAEVGIYNVVLPSALMLVFFSKSVAAVAFPLVSELWAKNEKKKLAQGIGLVLKYSYIFLLPVISTGIVFSSFFISFFFGDEYASGSVALQILLLGVFVYIATSANNSSLSGIGKPKIVTGIILFAAAINTVLNLLLVPRFGINGSAFATMISYLFMSVISTYMVIKHLGVKSPFRDWLVFIIPGGLFYLIQSFSEIMLALNPWVEIFISIVFAGSLYVISLKFLRIIDLQELKKIIRIIKRGKNEPEN